MNYQKKGPRHLPGELLDGHVGRLGITHKDRLLRRQPIRLDALHQPTPDLTRRFDVIGIEDLNGRGMVRNRHLARSIADMGFHAFRRQAAYRAAGRGAVVVAADRFFPSSNLCPACGVIQDEMPRSLRTWTCPACRTAHDRDLNAAINLAHHAVGSTVSACEGGRLCQWPSGRCETGPGEAGS